MGEAGRSRGYATAIVVALGAAALLGLYTWLVGGLGLAGAAYLFVARLDVVLALLLCVPALAARGPRVGAAEAIFAGLAILAALALLAVSLYGLISSDFRAGAFLQLLGMVAVLSLIVRSLASTVRRAPA